MDQIYLYEWQWKKLPEGINPTELKRYLGSVWESRMFLFDQEEEEQTEEEESDLKRYKQGFLRFDGSYISAKNYVGFIQYDGLGINILPKVFARNYPNPSGHIENITSNLLNWIKYSKRIRFPFSEVSFEEQRFDHLLEPFVFIFSEYTNRLLEKLPYQCFEEITEPTTFLKGRLSINKYINESLATGNFQNIISTYDSFEFNNQFNQIIKNVTNLLINNTSNSYSRERLHNILFMLDDVEEKECTIQDCDKIHFGPLYEEWNTILNMSRMFLANQSFKSQDQKKSNFCFLVPMELIYEEYIAGILEKHSDRKIHIQPRFKYLTQEGLFQLKPDLLYDDSIIIDTKYKLLDDLSDDGKYGISQGDLYQMLAYAVRYKKNKIILLYPDDKLLDDLFVGNIKEFSIKDEFSQESISIQIKSINITSYSEDIIVLQLLASSLTTAF